MKLEDQVCSLELSKQLNDLSVKQESLWYWGKYAYGKEYGLVCPIYYNEHPYELECSAFTVAELGEMLPTYIKYERWEFSYRVEYDFKNGYGVQQKTEADARAKMLIWLIKNGKVKI